jgi:hypothetical protein
VLSIGSVNTPAAPLPSSNWAFSRYSNHAGASPRRAWGSRRFSGTSSEKTLQAAGRPSATAMTSRS